MGPRSKIKKSRKSVMFNKGKSGYYLCAVLGICLACLPLFIVASQFDEEPVIVVGPSAPVVEPDDLEAAESQNYAAIPPQVAPVQMPGAPVQAVAPAPVNVAAPSQPQAFVIPKADLASAPSYAPRYAVPPVNPYRERLPYEVQSFRRRATAEEGPSEDDYQPSESKGKKSAPGIIKRVTGSIRNTGKAIVGAPSYIFKRYRGTWKKYFGGGKKKKGWKSWSSSSDKSDGWGGWEETEPHGGWEPSHYPTEKGWSSSTKGWAPSKGWDSHERRSDRERDDYDYDYHRPSRPREKQRWNQSYKEETHYDEYDGRRTTASYPRKSKRPNNGGSGSGYKHYDDDY